MDNVQYEMAYYLIDERRLVRGRRRAGGGLVLAASEYKDGKWVSINPNDINDRLVGYDPSEPPGSPYGMYDDDIMDEIQELSKEEAEEIIRQRG